MKLNRLLAGFWKSEKTSGIILVLCTLLSLVLANSNIGPAYTRLWEYHLAGAHLSHWINDGLMAVFFLLIGLELEREVYSGELSTMRNAAFPVVAAVGGMLVPAGLFLLLNKGLPTQPGAGIPMATDIAFALGILSLLGKRVPLALKIFLTALAVIDDLGAILTIAIFYSKNLSLGYLGMALGIFALLLVLNRLKVHSLIPYLLGGTVMWYFMLHSGVHATITGVLTAFAIPFGNGDKTTASYRLQDLLHKPVAFFILPVFALANTCIMLPAGWTGGLASPGSLGIFAGLLLGKPLGILLFCGIAVSTGLCRLPAGLQWKHIAGAGLLGGIGFTMSIFITLLAFRDQEQVIVFKIAVLLASTVAALMGLLVLFIVLRRHKVVLT